MYFDFYVQSTLNIKTANLSRWKAFGWLPECSERMITVKWMFSLWFVASLSAWTALNYLSNLCKLHFAISHHKTHYRNHQRITLCRLFILITSKDCFFITGTKVMVQRFINLHLPSNTSFYVRSLLDSFIYLIMSCSKLSCKCKLGNFQLNMVCILKP